MFFWQMVRGALEMGLEDFSYPPEVRLVHQAHSFGLPKMIVLTFRGLGISELCGDAQKAHFNAFVPPASVDWMAHEWRPSNFVRHFAGCPWQEQPCLQMMVAPRLNQLVELLYFKVRMAQIRIIGTHPNP